MHHPISYKFGRPGIGSSKAPNFNLSSALFRPATLGPRSEKLRFQPSRMRKWEYITIVFIAITDVILRWHRPANLWIHQLPRPWRQCKVQRTLLAANISDMLRLQSAALSPNSLLSMGFEAVGSPIGTTSPCQHAAADYSLQLVVSSSPSAMVLRRKGKRMVPLQFVQVKSFSPQRLTTPSFALF